MMRCVSSLFVVMVLARGAFAAGLVVPPGGVALGEVQPGEAIEKTLDDEKHRRFVIGRVLERGKMQDWIKTKEKYGLSLVVHEAQQMRSLDSLFAPAAIWMLIALLAA